MIKYRAETDADLKFNFPPLSWKQKNLKISPGMPAVT